MGFSEFPVTTGSGSSGGGTSGSQTGVPYSVGTFNLVNGAANGATIGSLTLYLQGATATVPGLVSSASQTFAGVKTFGSNPIFSGVAVSSPLRTDGAGALSIGSTSLENEVRGALPLSQTSGSISLTTQVVGVLPSANLPPLSEISGSVSLTTQVSGVLPSGNTQPLSALTGSVSLTGQVSGILPSGNLPSGIIIGSVSLTTQVSGVLPQANMTGVLGSNTGDVSFANFGSTPNAQGASVGAGQVVTLQPASSAQPGGVTTGSQEFGGAKTFFSTRATTVTIGSVSLTSAAGGGDVSATWPAANASGVLTNNGSGTLSWEAAGVAATTVTGSTSFAAWNSSASAWGDLTSISITPGTWDIFATMSIATGGGASTWQLGIGVVSGNNAPFGGAAAVDYTYGTIAAASNASFTFFKLGYVVGSTTTVYAKALYSSTGGQAGGVLSASKRG